MSTKKRIVFIGASKFGGVCLNSILHESSIELVGAVTSTELFKISYSESPVKNALFFDISRLTQARGIPTYVIGEAGMKDAQLVSFIEQLKPDLCVVVGWYHMVPASIRSMVKCVGIHASMLPKYSGGAPLVWAMINGETRTGVTLFEFEAGVDSGDIWAQAEIEITPEDTIATLYSRVETIGVTLLEQSLQRWSAGDLKPITQKEDQRTLYPQRSPEDGVIDWKWSAERIYNFVRAQTKPYPGAFSVIGSSGKKIHIWSCRPLGSYSGQEKSPGTVLDGFRVIVGNREYIEVLDASDESGSPISLRLGDKLVS